MLAAKIFFYDQTQQMVDLFGDIPWSEAGKVRQSGDLEASLPKYDNAKEIYEAMLTDLKDIADELNSITVAAFYGGLFQTKDYLNNGDISLWKKYCNSLRLRLLIRGSDVLESSFTGRLLQFLLILRLIRWSPATVMTLCSMLAARIFMLQHPVRLVVSARLWRLGGSSIWLHTPI
jgi:hypothetical protein